MHTYASIVKRGLKATKLREYPKCWASPMAREPSRSRTIEVLISKGIKPGKLFELEETTGCKYRFFETIVTLYGHLLK